MPPLNIYEFEAQGVLVTITTYGDEAAAEAILSGTVKNPELFTLNN
jgi:hypothetical protein